jgi:hypothetical protein
MKLKSIILLAVVAALSACSFEKNNSLTDPNEVALREKAKAAYKAISGTYTGTIEASNGTQTIQIRLFMLEADSGSNSNGVGRKMPTLNAAYKKIQPIGPGFDFTASYLQDTNELVLTNSSKTPLSNDDVHTMNLQFVNNHLVGKATYRGGYQGNIDLVLTTRESAGNGGTTEENEYYDNLRKQYQEVAGYYEGQVLNADGKAVITLTVRLSVQNTASPENSNISIPSLVGIQHDVKDVIIGNDETPMRDSEGFPMGMADTKLTATYNVDTNPRRLTLYGSPIHGGDFKCSFDGPLVGDEYRGTYEQGPYPLRGLFVLKKKDPPARPKKN